MGRVYGRSKTPYNSEKTLEDTIYGRSKMHVFFFRFCSLWRDLEKKNFNFLEITMVDQKCHTIDKIIVWRQSMGPEKHMGTKKKITWWTVSLGPAWKTFRLLWVGCWNFLCGCSYTMGSPIVNCKQWSWEMSKLLRLCWRMSAASQPASQPANRSSFAFKLE